MTVEDLEDSADLHLLLENPLFSHMSIECLMHTLLLFVDAEELWDIFKTMVNDYDCKFYAKEVQYKLKVLYDRLIKEAGVQIV